MPSITFYTILSVLAVTLVSVIGILPLLLKKKPSSRLLLILVSLSAGSLFGGALIHLIPESVENGFTLKVSLSILAGIMTFFILEKFIHWHHSHHEYAEKDKPIHGHAYHLAAMNLIGDGIHNFLDGLIIASGYLISVPLGVATTISVVFHEIPQEIADFGVLLYSGLSKFKAVMFNLLSALTALIGAIVGLTLPHYISGFTQFIIPFAAGGFLYIAGSNLVPELHKHCEWKESFFHLLAMLSGIGIMILLAH